jgi:hypothetical protein
MVAEEAANSRGVAVLVTNFMTRPDGEVNLLED